jgi:methylmalonyl-CoA decarboxylase
MSLILKQVQGSAGIVTMNHAPKRNVLSRALIEELIAALDEMKAASVRSVILRAQPGATVWSAGHDVTELPTSGRDPLAYDDPLRRVVRAIETIPLPVIAMIEGSVWGGACELAITCDLAIAAPDVTFAFTPTKLGVPYNTVGMLNMMKSIGVPLLKEMLFTARPISAERALHVGMINEILPRDELERFTLQIAAQIAETSPMCVALVKEELRILSKSRPMSAETFERLQGLRRNVYDSHDYREGIRSFLEKRRPEFTGK